MKITRFLPLLVAIAGSVISMTAAPKFSLLTAGPGADMYQLEGHTALRIVADDGGDYAVNWGVFDFNAPNFAYRFVKGETDYSIGICPFDLFLYDYSRQGRYVVEQPLNLTDAEARELQRLIEINLQPENREYRYNYVLDNCATRPLALIEKSLAADDAKLHIDMPDEDATFRGEMRKYHRNFPSYQLFIDLALGSGIDRPISTRERAFAPVFLMDMASHSTITSADGTIRPLTLGCRELLPDKLGEAKEKGFPGWIFAAIVTASAILMTWTDIRRKKTSRWYDTCFYTIYGLLGCLVAFLVFISVHEATSPNINLMWANPICLIIPLFIWFKKCKCIVFYFQIINFALLLVWLAGQPFYHQSLNWLFIPLVLSDMMRSACYIYINRRCQQSAACR